MPVWDTYIQKDFNALAEDEEWVAVIRDLITG